MRHLAGRGVGAIQADIGSKEEVTQVPGWVAQQVIGMAPVETPAVVRIARSDPPGATSNVPSAVCERPRALGRAPPLVRDSR